jgi:hypothetical protein
MHSLVFHYAFMNFSVEMNRTFNASAAEKIAPNSQIAEIDIRIKADAAPQAPAGTSINSNSTAWSASCELLYQN